MRLTHLLGRSVVIQDVLASIGIARQSLNARRKSFIISCPFFAPQPDSGNTHNSGAIIGAELVLRGRHDQNGFGRCVSRLAQSGT